MANAFQETIDRMKAEGGLEEAVAFLESKKSELGDDISEEDVQKLLLEHLMSEVISSGEDIQLDADESEFMDKATASVREVLDDDDWHYSERSIRPDYVVFEAGCRGRHCANLRLRVAVETNPRTCHVKTILPISAEEIYAYPLCKMITKMNYSFRYGGFVYDERDGEISFDFTYPIKNGVDKDNFRTAIGAALSSADVHYDEIRNYSVGRFKKSEVEQILTEVKKLVVDLKSLDE